MRAWEHGGGFSVDARVRVEAVDRRGWSASSGTAPEGPWRSSAWSATPMSLSVSSTICRSPRPTGGSR